MTNRVSIRTVAPRRSTRSPRQRLLAGVLVALTTLAVPVASVAAPAERDRQAGQLFYEGRYEEALKIYIELAFETKRPEYMCNIGRCYARLGRIDEAIHNMRDCLAQAPLDARKRAEYETHVRALEAQRSQGGAAPVPSTPIYPGGAPSAPPAQGQANAPSVPATAGPSTPAAPGSVAPGQGWPPVASGAPPYPQTPAPGGYPAPGAGYPQAGPPAAAPGPYYGANPSYGPTGAYPTGPVVPPGPAAAPPAVVQEKAGKPRKRKRLLPFASYVTGGVGLVAVTAGVAFGLQSKGIYDDLAVRFDPDREREAKRANTAQIVSYAVGGVALATAAVIAIVAGRQPDDPAAVALMADGQSAGWSWRF